MTEQPFRIHVGSLTLTKIADGLIDPKLVLAWLLNALGAPGYIIGTLVPVREVGSLLPQLLLARQIEASSERKGFWIAGSAVQGLASIGIAIAALALNGALAGGVVLACLAILAVARSACSASYKEVLARTVEKGQRGRVSGLAGTLAAVAVFGFALLLSFGIWPREPNAVAVAVFLAGLLWLAAALLFSRLKEPSTDPDDLADNGLADLVAPLRDAPEFQTYVATRALLVSTALAPPFLVLLGGLGGEALGNLGVLMIASSLAAIVSSYLWGALSDRTSPWTLIVSGAAAAATFLCAAVIGFMRLSDGAIAIPGLIFAAQIAYQGARAGRKTHLTDMDAGGRTAVYTALSNTLIGVMLLAGGLLGLVSDMFGPSVVLFLLGVMSCLAVLTGWRLSEVQSMTS